MTSQEIKSYISEAEFSQHIKDQRKPAILRHFNIGNCLEFWQNTDYLKAKLAGKMCKIHVVDKNQVDKMDFKSKNFKYGSIEMTELIENVFESTKTQDNDGDNNDKAYYLRWVGDDPRGQTRANFSQDFSSLAADFELPKNVFYPEEKFFSSVLRISSPGIRVWTHYDVMDNVYVQIIGVKDVIMWSPDQALNLYLDGDKSKVVDLNDPHLDEKFPRFKNASKYFGRLQAGDLLFIPALWFHNMKAVDAGIAINVFWKNLEEQLYDKKDPYGNKDLLPAAKAMRMLDNVWHQLDGLPEQYRDFYARQLISRLEEKCLSNKDISAAPETLFENKN